MNPTIIVTVLTLVGKLVPLGAEIAGRISDAMADGDISAQEAEDIGSEIGTAAGRELVLKVRGQDVLHGPAMALIGGGLARVARQVVLALRD